MGKFTMLPNLIISSFTSFVFFTIIFVCWILQQCVINAIGGGGARSFEKLNNPPQQKFSYSVNYGSSSDEWKSSAIASGGLFWGNYFTSKFNHNFSDFSSNYASRVCYNTLFIGSNNQPIFNVSDLNDIRSYASKDEPTNLTPPPRYVLVQADGKGWPGLFLCPLTYEQIGKSECCGPRHAEYCCSVWEIENMNMFLLFVGTVILLILSVVYKAYRKKILCFSKNPQENNNVHQHHQHHQQDVLYSRPFTESHLPHQSVSTNTHAVDRSHVNTNSHFNQTNQDYSKLPPPPSYNEAIQM